MERQKGGLLIELVISMAIGIFLMYGVLQMLLTSKQNYLVRSALSELDQGGQIALDAIAEDIRLAGYKGCTPQDSEIGIDASLDSQFAANGFDPDLGIRGWEYINTGPGASLVSALWSPSDAETKSAESDFSGSNWLTGGVDDAEKAIAGKGGDSYSVVREADVLRLWSIYPYIGSAISATNSSLRLAQGTNTGFPESGSGEHFLIASNCEKSLLVAGIDYFYNSGYLDIALLASSVTQELPGMKANVNIPLQVAMMKMAQYSLEVPSGRKRSSLYRRIFSSPSGWNPKEELMPGVVNMQFLYGEDTDDDASANRYVTADQISRWQDVVSVQVWLMLETENPVLPRLEESLYESQTVNYYGQNMVFNDGRLRRAYMRTITLRNRMLGEVQ